MFKDKIKELREKKKLTKKEIAKIIDVSERAYITYEYGQREPSMDTIIKLADFYEVTTDYLLGRETKKEPDVLTKLTKEYNLTETERILVSAYLGISKEERTRFIETIEKTIEMKEAEEKTLPIFTFKHFSINKASAGCGYDLNNADIWQDLEVVDTPEARGADFAVEIDGHSMEPTYQDGDIVYIVKALEVPEGKVGLFIQNGKGYIKEAGKNCLISHNPDYPDVYPKDGRIECIGRVIGVAGLL